MNQTGEAKVSHISLTFVSEPPAEYPSGRPKRGVTGQDYRTLRVRLRIQAKDNGLRIRCPRHGRPKENDSSHQGASGAKGGEADPDDTQS